MADGGDTHITAGDVCARYLAVPFGLESIAGEKIAALALFKKYLFSLFEFLTDRKIGLIQDGNISLQALDALAEHCQGYQKQQLQDQ